MADTAVAITAGTGTNIDTRTEATNGNHRQVVVLGDPSTNAGVAPVDATKGLAVDLSATGANTNKLLVTPDLPSGASTSAAQTTGNNSLSSIDGKITAVNTGAVVISSSALPSGASTAAKQPALGTAGSASADVLSVQGVASMTALKVDGTGGSFPVTDSGGSLTVDNGGTFAVQADTELTTADLDTGAGTDTRAVVGLVGSKSGGGVLIPGDATAGLKVDLGADNDVTITSGTITTVSAVTAISNALPAGTNAIGKLAANSGVDIGDVDVTSVTPGTTATALGKAEDAAHASGDVGVMALGVRSDAGSAFGADGDYVPLSVDASGAVRVTGGGGGTQYTEDVAAATDPVGSMGMAVRQDTLSGTTVSADGDNIALRATSKGELYVKQTDAVILAAGSATIGALTSNQTVNVNQIGGAAISTANGTGGTGVQRVTIANDSDGVLAGITTSIVPGTSATHLGKAEDAAHTNGATGVMTLSVRQDTAAALAGTDADYQPLITDSTGRLHVNVGNTVTVGSHAVTNAGTFVTQENGAALTALQLMDDTIFTDDAAFTPGTSKISSVGFLADETATDSVDEGDIGIARITLDRKQIVVNYAHAAGGYTPGKLVSAASTNATSVTAAATTLGYLTASNVNAAARYLKIYNKASAPTVGTDVPVATFIIPGNTAGAGTNIPLPPQGMALGTGFAFALTTEATDAGTTGVALSEIVINYGYK